MNKTIIAILSAVLIGVIMWSGIVTGGGVIENPAINTWISIGLSLIILDIVSSMVAVVLVVLLITLISLFIGADTFVGLVLMLISALLSLIPATFLIMTWFGNWFGFFPAYPTNTRWVIAVCIGVINLVFTSVKKES